MRRSSSIITNAAKVAEGLESNQKTMGKGTGLFETIVEQRVVKQMEIDDEANLSMLAAVVDDEEDGMIGNYEEKQVATMGAEIF